jgi:hypothetical protein
MPAKWDRPGAQFRTGGRNSSDKPVVLISVGIHRDKDDHNM